MIFWFLLYSVFLLDICDGLSTPDSPTYGAAVVEFNPKWDVKDLQERTNQNLRDYLEIIAQLPNSVDIVVFPESTLNNLDTAVFIPEVDDNEIPCDSKNYSDEPLLKKLSCAAKSNKKYVVINLTEKATCPDKQMLSNNDERECDSSGLSIYNTNIVFDRTGTIISRYRKFNLFENVNKPKYPEAVTFTTDFGVTFGHFICFDLMFKEPALKLVREMNVTDVIFPTMWFSELPFLTAVQIQQFWAYKNNVNFLAAGANNPEVGSTGTGIYAGKLGPLVAAMKWENKNEVFTATVPKIGSGIEIESKPVKGEPKDMDALFLKRDQLDVYKTRPLLCDEKIVNENICYEDLCCDFELEFDTDESFDKIGYEYRLAVFHGIRTFDGFADGNMLSCSIIACSNHSLESCGIRFDAQTYNSNVINFKKIKISGNFPYNDDYFILPNAVDTSIMPIKISEFEYDESETVDLNGKQHRYISMELTEPRADLLVFGIYGRDFTSSSYKITSSIVLIFLALLISHLFAN